MNTTLRRLGGWFVDHAAWTPEGLLGPRVPRAEVDGPLAWAEHADDRAPEPGDYAGDLRQFCEYWRYDSRCNDAERGGE